MITLCQLLNLMICLTVTEFKMHSWIIFNECSVKITHEVMGLVCTCFSRSVIGHLVKEFCKRLQIKVLISFCIFIQLMDRYLLLGEQSWNSQLLVWGFFFLKKSSFPLLIFFSMLVITDSKFHFIPVLVCKINHSNTVK